MSSAILEALDQLSPVLDEVTELVEGSLGKRDLRRARSQIRNVRRRVQGLEVLVERFKLLEALDQLSPVFDEMTELVEGSLGKRDLRRARGLVHKSIGTLGQFLLLVGGTAAGGVIAAEVISKVLRVWGGSDLCPISRDGGA